MARDPWPMPYYATFPPLSPEMSLFSERNEGAQREIRREKPRGVDRRCGAGILQPE